MRSRRSITVQCKSRSKDTTSCTACRKAEPCDGAPHVKIHHRTPQVPMQRHTVTLNRSGGETRHDRQHFHSLVRLHGRDRSLVGSPRASVTFFEQSVLSHSHLVRPELRELEQLGRRTSVSGRIRIDEVPSGLGEGGTYPLHDVYRVVQTIDAEDGSQSGDDSSSSLTDRHHVRNSTSPPTTTRTTLPPSRRAQDPCRAVTRGSRVPAASTHRSAVSRALCDPRSWIPRACSSFVHPTCRPSKL